MYSPYKGVGEYLPPPPPPDTDQKPSSNGHFRGSGIFEIQSNPIPDRLATSADDGGTHPIGTWKKFSENKSNPYLSLDVKGSRSGFGVCVLFSSVVIFVPCMILQF